MISDVLYDSERELLRYLRDFNGMYTDPVLRKDLLLLINEMERIRLILDRCSDDKKTVECMMRGSLN